MRPGDLVRLKKGIFGIPEGKELAIVIARTRVEKEHVLEVFTVKGIKHVKPYQCSQRNLPKFRYAGSVEDQGQMRKALAEVMKKTRSVKGKEGSVEDLVRSLDERKLWDKCAGAGPQSFEQIAQAYWGTTSDVRIDAVKEVLMGAGGGVGYFPRSSFKDVIPLTHDEYESAKEHQAILQTIREKLVKERETESGGIQHGAVMLEDAELTSEEEATLEQLMGWMKEYVATGERSKEATLGSSPTQAIDGFSIYGYAKMLANDWLGTRLQTASAFVMFLWNTGHWDLHGALDAITRFTVSHSDQPIEPEFTELALKEAERLKEELEPNELVWRKDLRDVEMYTIDPPDAKDFDDAVSYEKTAKGHKLGVHIADVTYYVHKDSRLDMDASKRATSTYVPGSVIPMLPPRLSEVLCSLVDDGPRRAFSCVMEYDEQLNRTDVKVFPSYIHVDQNRRYPDVLEEIDAGNEPFASMSAFAQALDKKRTSLELVTPETKVNVGEGDDIGFTVKLPNAATEMIEVFMVEANNAVSELLASKALLHPYRVHPMPDTTDLKTMSERVKALDMGVTMEVDDIEATTLELKGESVVSQLASKFGEGLKVEGMEVEAEQEKASVYDPARQKLLADRMNGALDTVTGLEEPFRTIHTVLMLTALPRAFYSPEPIGHFGLGLARYAHFTSPIRRYADVIVHRCLKAMLAGEDQPYTEEELHDVSKHCSEMSDNADRVERTMVDVCYALATLKEGKTSETMTAYVISVQAWGLFVLLPSGAEGRVSMPKQGRIRTLPDEFGTRLLMPQYDEVMRRMRFEPELASYVKMFESLPVDPDGERVIARVGQKLKVRFSATDAIEGRIELDLVSIE